jgi:hypothetical protein
MSKEKEETYQQRYYRKNKEKIAEYKANRYKNDSEYRRKIKERDAERKRLISEEKKKSPNYRKSSGKPIIHLVEARGREYEVRMYTTTTIDRTLNRRIGTVIRWEKIGLFPTALYRNERGHRLYTDFQYLLVKKAWDRALLESGIDEMMQNITRTSFFDYVKLSWKRYPYGIDLDD